MGFSGTYCNISLWPVVQDGTDVSLVPNRYEQASDERNNMMVDYKMIIRVSLQQSGKRKHASKMSVTHTHTHTSAYFGLLKMCPYCVQARPTVGV